MNKMIILRLCVCVCVNEREREVCNVQEIVMFYVTTVVHWNAFMYE